MISRSATPRATGATAAASSPAAAPVPPWQRLLGEAVSSLGELLDLVELAPEDLAAGWLDGARLPCDPASGRAATGRAATGRAAAGRAATGRAAPGRADLERVAAAARDFPLRVPRGFVDRMRRGDPADPLLRQVLPSAAELDAVPGFARDPLAEAHAAPAPGVLHKYRGRALLVVTGACAVHCRYCFRRHFPYAEHARDGERLRAALRYLAAEESIEEVILSGGDPLAASDARLAELAGELERIPHLRRLRVHTRLPVVLPERVDRPLLDWLTGTRLRPVVVIHANHGNEIDRTVGAAVAKLRAAGVAVLNQSVLLAGVNDEVESLRELSERLFAAGVLPYYLHLTDRVAGAAHFAVSEARARRLVWALTKRLSGYLVPRLVRERPGAPAKLPICVRGEREL